MDWGRFFFSAYGRIGRGDFWILFLVLLGAGVLIGWIPFVGLVLLYSSICARSKRLHDMGRTGWLQLVPIVTYTVVGLFTLYAIIGAIAASAAGGFEHALSAVMIGFGGLSIFTSWCIAFFVDLAFLLWIGLSEGQPFDNRFGPQRPAKSGLVNPTYPPSVA